LSNTGSNDRTSNKKADIFRSGPLRFDIKKLESSFYRADLEFHRVNHSGPSYEGRVFINNSQADENTPLNLENGYVGSYFIFGHGGCYADVGHCDVKERAAFDFRPPHPLTPIDLRLKITDQIKELGKNTDEFTVSVVPIVAGGSNMEQNLVSIDSISIVTYNR
jgi:hypothetical protein